MRKMTADDLDLAFHLLSKDTERYAEICDDFIRQHPHSPDGYYCRHNVWVRKRDWDKALSDLNANLILDPRAFSYIARGEVLHQAGRYAAAIEDFNRGEALDRKEWLWGFGPIRRAECYARTGNLRAALADCQDIEDDHWTPGVAGIIPGDKAAIIAEIKRLAR